MDAAPTDGDYAEWYGEAGGEVLWPVDLSEELYSKEKGQRWALTFGNHYLSVTVGDIVACGTAVLQDHFKEYAKR
jgi:hypothetical protein